MATSWINLNDIDTPRLDEPFVAFDIPFILTRTDGCHDCCPQLGISVKVLGWQGLFNPFESIGFEVPEALNGCRDIPNTSVSGRINDKLTFFPDHFTHTTDHLNIPLTIKTEYRLRTHPPTAFNDMVVLFSQPPKFVERPVQVFHIEDNGCHCDDFVVELTPKELTDR